MVEIFENLTKKINEYKNILVMSHKNTDLDGLTSSIALCTIARELGKNAYVFLQKDNSISDKVKYLADKDLVVNTYEQFNPNETLLIIVDTNSEIYVEDEKLLEI